MVDKKNPYSISREHDSIWPPKETLPQLASQTSSPTETDASFATFSDLSLISRELSNPNEDSLTQRPYMHQTCPIGRLPNELLVEIFKYISPFQLTVNASVVCKHWRQVALTPLLHRKLFLNGQAPGAACKKLIDDRPCLHTLRCVALKSFPYVVTSVCRLRYLQCLDMGFCDLEEACVLNLSKRVPQTLRHLNIEGCQAINLPFFENLIERCPDLEALNSSHCIRIDNDCLLALGCSHLKSLRRVNLDGVQWITDVGLREGLALLAAQLNAIWLDGFEITTEGLCAFLAEATSELKIFSVSFADNFNDALLPAIGGLPGLQELTLRKARLLTTPGLLKLFKTSIDSRYTSLTSIDLSDCPAVTDAVIDAICDCCGAKLLKLLLNWCWSVSDVGLARILGCCRSLRHLSLVGNHGISGESLISLPFQQPRLLFLNLTQCNQIIDAVILEVAHQMPSLHIFDYFGERVGGVDDVCQYDLLRVINREPICQH